MAELRARAMTRYTTGKGPLTDWVTVHQAEQAALAYRTPTREAWVEVECQEIDWFFSDIWEGEGAGRVNPIAVRADQVFARLDAVAAGLSANGQIEEWGGVQEAIRDLRASLTEFEKLAL